MRLIDVNILLYSVHEGAAEHRRVLNWLSQALHGPEPVCLSWVVVLAFLRISTTPHIFAAPLQMEEASRVIHDLFGHPNVELLHPTEAHWELLAQMLHDHQVRGADVTDAHLAALAIEHGATLCSTDRDFLRFRELRLFNPLTG